MRRAEACAGASAVAVDPTPRGHAPRDAIALVRHPGRRPSSTAEDEGHVLCPRQPRLGAEHVRFRRWRSGTDPSPQGSGVHALVDPGHRPPEIPPPRDGIHALDRVSVVARRRSLDARAKPAVVRSPGGVGGRNLQASYGADMGGGACGVLLRGGRRPCMAGRLARQPQRVARGVLRSLGGLASRPLAGRQVARSGRRSRRVPAAGTPIERGRARRLRLSVLLRPLLGRGSPARPPAESGSLRTHRRRLADRLQYPRVRRYGLGHLHRSAAIAPQLSDRSVRASPHPAVGAVGGPRPRISIFSFPGRPYVRYGGAWARPS